MGWEISIKVKEGQEPKYRIWTTISDGWITEWLTKEETIKFLFWHRFSEFMESILKDAMTFPQGWIEKGSNYKMLTNVNSDDFYEFRLKALDAKNPNMVMGAKFGEILTNLGIKFEIEDIDGYSFYSKENGHEIKKD